MTTAITNTATIIGIDAHIIEVEADVSIGLGNFSIVGLPDGTIRESKERITAALNNSCSGFPIRKVVINLAPADIKKMGTGFDRVQHKKVAKSKIGLDSASIDM